MSDTMNSAEQTEEFVLQLTRVQRGVYVFIQSLVHNWNEADEIFQETNLVLWRKFSEFEPGTSFLRWACQVAYYEVLKYRKRRTRQELLLPDDLLATMATEAMAEVDEVDSARRALQVCLERLPAEERKLVRLRYDEDTSAQLVAEQLGKSVSAIHKALNRVRWKLLECVRRQLSAEGAS